MQPAPPVVRPPQRYHAALPRRLLWLLLTLLLARLTLFYVQEGLAVAAVISGLWGLFAASWVWHLWRTPWAEVTPEQITLLERLRFGRPNRIVLTPENLVGVTPLGRARLALELHGMGTRYINLRYLRRRDRQTILAALQEFTRRDPARE